MFSQIIKQQEAEIWLLKKELQTYKEAEEQGSLVRLPCKAGDIIYDIYEFISNRCQPEVIEYKADTIGIKKDKSGRLYFIIDSTIFHPEDFGKTAFLTKGDAINEILKLT